MTKSKQNSNNNKEIILNFLDELSRRYLVHTSYIFGETALRIFYDKLDDDSELNILSNVPWEYIKKSYDAVVEKIPGTDMYKCKIKNRQYEDVSFNLYSVYDYEWEDAWIIKYAKTNLDLFIIDRDGHISTIDKNQHTLNRILINNDIVSLDEEKIDTEYIKMLINIKPKHL